MKTSESSGAIQHAIEPAVQKPTLGEVLANLAPIEEEFPTVDDPPVQPEQVLAWPTCRAATRRGKE